MKIFITSILFLFIVKVSSAQFLQDIQGRPILENTYTDIIGTPFFNNDFIEGNVILSNGDKFEKVPLKYSNYKDELFFKNPKDGSLLSFVLPVKSFELLGQKYICGLPNVDNFNTQTFYQLIFDGKVKLLLKNHKTILENKPYNSATIEKKFEESLFYYAFKEGKMKRFKPSKKDLLELFSDKGAEVDAFLKKEKIDFKNNTDLAKVFEYYSAL